MKDEAAAEVVGKLVLACVGATPEDSEMTVGFFESRSGLRLYVVGPAQMADVDAVVTVPEDWTLSVQNLGEQVLVELAGEAEVLSTP